MESLKTVAPAGYKNKQCRKQTSVLSGRTVTAYVPLRSATERERAAFLIPRQGLRGYFANFLFIQQILRQIHRGLHMFRIGIDAHDDAVTTEVISISRSLQSVRQMPTGTGSCMSSGWRDRDSLGYNRYSYHRWLLRWPVPLLCLHNRNKVPVPVSAHQ